MPKVLVVDDDTFILEGIKRVAGRSFEIDVANNGHEALHMLMDEGPYAAVVSDMSMWGMSGIEFLEMARSVAPMTTRVIMSGYADQDALSASINRASVFRFLNKPFSRKEFFDCLTDSVAAFQSAFDSQPRSANPVMDQKWIQTELEQVDFDRDFSVRYQPRVVSDSGALYGVEALVRWTHPKWGSISPMDFIPVAEKTSAIRELTSWVLGKACQTWSDWRHQSDLDVAMSVNLSPVLFSDPGLVPMVWNTITRSGMDPSKLELEITEGLDVNQYNLLHEKIAGLKSLGVSMSIDDFGTGFASMSYLQSLDVDCIKIDRSLVTNAPDNDKDCSILRAVRNLGQQLVSGTKSL
ncbi:MAG: EAL domain-containing response regulator [Alphaproteobacteria bacterium]|nr:EAL domain-containing response regulator [Alphaproteobacteria bacterium]